MLQYLDEGIQLFRRMLAGNDKAEVAVAGAAQVVDQGWINAGGKQSFTQSGGSSLVVRNERNVWSWPFVNLQPGFTQSGFDITGVEGKPAAQICAFANKIKCSVHGSGQRQRQWRVAHKQSAARNDSLSHFTRTKHRPAINAESLAERNGANDSPRRDA